LPDELSKIWEQAFTLIHSVTKTFIKPLIFIRSDFGNYHLGKEPRILSSGSDNTRVHYFTLLHELKHISNTPRLWIGMKKSDNVLHGLIFVAELWGWRYLDEYFIHNSWFNHNILNNLLCYVRPVLSIRSLDRVYAPQIGVFSLYFAFFFFIIIKFHSFFTFVVRYCILNYNHKGDKLNIEKHILFGNRLRYFLIGCGRQRVMLWWSN